MKNKRGFTLVELLAVIAILAVLVIIALPNVVRMFNNAKKDVFINETKEIYKIAEQQYINDSLLNSGEQKYSSNSACVMKELDISGGKEIEYYIKFNSSGKVIAYYVTDGTYQYVYNGADGELKITDIKDVDEVANLNNAAVLDIGDIACNGGNPGGGNTNGGSSDDYSDNVISQETSIIYSISSTSFTIGQQVPSDATIYDNYEDINEGVFLKLVIQNEIIKEIYIGIYEGDDSDPIFFRGGINESSLDTKPIYDNNMSLLTNYYESEDCHGYYSTVSCFSDSKIIYGGSVDDYGSISFTTVDGGYAGRYGISGDYYYNTCTIYSQGTAYCNQ